MSVEKIKKKFSKIDPKNRFQLISNAIQHLPEEIRSKIPSVPHDHPEELFGKLTPEVCQLIMQKIQEFPMQSVLEISMGEDDDDDNLEERVRNLEMRMAFSEHRIVKVEINQTNIADIKKNVENLNINMENNNNNIDKLNRNFEKMVNGINQQFELIFKHFSIPRAPVVNLE